MHLLMSEGADHAGCLIRMPGRTTFIMVTGLSSVALGVMMQRLMPNRIRRKYS